MGATTEYVYKLEAVQDSKQLQAEVEQLRAENNRLTDQLQRSQERANRLQEQAKRLQAQLSTEITQEELTGRGLQLPEESLTFPVEQYAQHRAELKGKGGVYAFYHEVKGYLYVGVSADLGERLRNHVNGNKQSNNGLYQQLQQLSGVTVTVYREPDSGIRELYENYLILRYNPVCNKAKVSELTDGYNLNYRREQKQRVQQALEQKQRVQQAREYKARMDSILDNFKL